LGAIVFSIVMRLPLFDIGEPSVKSRVDEGNFFLFLMPGEKKGEGEFERKPGKKEEES
jgi:hypothetical protein